MNKNYIIAVFSVLPFLLLSSALPSNQISNLSNASNSVINSSLSNTINLTVVSAGIKSSYSINNTQSNSTHIFENGLPNGIQWKLIINNATMLNATTPNAILISMIGNYIVTVPNLIYANITYLPNQDSINNIMTNTINISYSMVQTTNFIENGLPNNSLWGVYYYNITESTESNTISFNTISGNYHYLISNVMVGNTLYKPQINGSYLQSGAYTIIKFNRYNQSNRTIIGNYNNSNITQMKTLNASNAITIPNISIYNSYKSTKNFIQNSLNLYNITSGSLLNLNLSIQNYTIDKHSWVNNLTSIQIQKINDFKNYIKSKNKKIIEMNKTLQIKYGILKQNNKIVSAGKKLNFILYNNSTIIYYLLNITKNSPDLHINVNGYSFNTPNATMKMYVPIIAGKTNYNLSINLGGQVSQNNNMLYSYSILFNNQTSVSGDGNYTRFNKSFKYTLKSNQGATITFDTLGNQNYSAVDPTIIVIPVNILYYLPITITNSQSVQTFSPFQQMIAVNSNTYKNYETGNLDNIEFFYQNSTLVPSWLEGNSLYTYPSTPGVSNSSTNTIYWLQLKSILANSNVIIYMGFANTSTNLFSNTMTGEAPTLSTTYGEYDNGNSIFNFYQSFGGLSSLPTSWQLLAGSGPGSFSTDYYEIGANASAGGINTTSSYNTTKSLIEVYLKIPLTTGINASGFGVGNKYFVAISHKGATDEFAGTSAGSAMAYDSTYSVVSGSLQLFEDLHPAVSSTTYNGIPTIYGIGYNYSFNTTYFFENYNNVYTYTKVPSHPDMTINIVSNITGENLYWVRVRYLPPNNIMPSATFGSLLGVARFSENGLPNSGELWNVTYDGAIENATTPNTIIFSDTPGNYAFSIPNQIVGGITYTPNVASGYVVTGNSTAITFSQLSSATCTISFNSNSINFGSINPSSSTLTVNGIIDSNTGTANAYMYVFGGNWISGSNFFGVSNTSYSSLSGVAFSSASKLSTVATNTLLYVGAGSSNTIYFGINTPKAISTGAYTQTITIENSC